MAPKAKATAAKAKAKTTIRPKQKAKAAPKASAAAQALDLATGGRRRQLARRDTAEQAERALRQHLPGVPLNRVRATADQQGVSAQQFLEESIRQCRLEGGRLAATFWRECARRFGFDGLQKVEFDNMPDGGEIGEDVQIACDTAMAKAAAQRDVGPLQALLEFRHQSQWSRREVFGVCQCLIRMLEKQYVNRPKVFELFVNVLQLVERLGKGLDWADDLKKLKDFFVEGLSKNFSEAKAAKVTPRRWLLGIRGSLLPFVSEDTMNSILATEGPLLANQSIAVARAVNALPCMEPVLSSLVTQLSGKKFGDGVDAVLAEMTAEMGEQAQTALFKQISGLAVAEIAVDPRAKMSHQCKFLDCKMGLSDLSPHTLANVMGYARTKSIGLLHSANLVRLPWEKPILPVLQEPEFTISVTQLTKINSARNTAVEISKNAEGKDILSVLRALREHERVMLGFDSSFLLELLWLENAAPALYETKATETALGFLPDAEQNVSLTQAINQLTVLLDSDLLVMAPPSVNKMVRDVLTLVQRLQRKLAPEIGSHNTPFMVAVLARAAFFYQRSDLPRGSTRPCRAPRALEERFAEIKRDFDASEKLPDPEVLYAMQPFRWLFTNQQFVVMQEYCARATASASTTTSRAAGGSSSSSRGAGGAGRGKASSEDIMALFG